MKTTSLFVNIWFWINWFYILKCDAANILGVTWWPGTSHQAIFQPIWRELSLRGHHVTIISPIPLKDERLTNLTEIDVSFLFNVVNKFDLSKEFSKDNWAWQTFIFSKHIGMDVVEALLNKDDVKELINSSKDFDVIIVEAHTPLVYAFGERFKAPVIGLSSFSVGLDIFDIMGNPTHPLISPHYILQHSYQNNQSIVVRLKMFLFQIWSRIYHYGIVMPRSDKIARKYFGNNIPYLGEILRKYASMLLINVNVVTNSVRANVPNVVEISQIHIRENQTLPKDLQEYLDCSSNGAIYFSLGTHVASSHLKNETLDEIVRAFAELPFNVLWKWEKNTLPNQPRNVLIRKFFPQQDLLGHPNIKVFITQGGMQSIEEAISNEVPMVGIPQIADQPINVERLVEIGVAVKLDSSKITKESLKNAILEVSENKRYKENVRKYKSILQDQPLKGVDKAIWWIEYVIRHRGTEHLRSPSADMTFYEYLMLDVIILLFSISFALSYFTYRGFRFIRRVLKSKEKCD